MNLEKGKDLRKIERYAFISNKVLGFLKVFQVLDNISYENNVGVNVLEVVLVDCTEVFRLLIRHQLCCLFQCSISVKEEHEIHEA